MCVACRHDVQRGFAPTRRSVLLAASAMGVLLADPLLAKGTKAPPKPENVCRRMPP